MATRMQAPRTGVRQLWRGVAGRCAPALRRVGPSLLLAVVLFVGTLAPFARAGLGIYAGTAHATAHAAETNGGKPNRFDPRRASQSILHLPPAPRPPATRGPVAPVALDRAAGGSAALGSVTLDPARAARYTGGQLEVDVPAGAVTPADVTAAGGPLALRVAEIAPAAGASAGGSGLVSFGTYLLQVVDAHGHLAAHGLRRPVTLRLRLPRRTSAFDLSRAFAVVNGALPRGVTTQTAATAYGALAPTAATAAPVSARAIGLGIYATRAAPLAAGALNESFTGGPNHSLSGSYTYGYDARGELTSATETVGAAAYTVGQSYDDAGAPTTQTYPDGEQVTTTYTEGWLGGLTTTQGGTTTTLLGAATYSGVGGAAGLVTQASLGNGTYTYQADYDLLLRPTSTLDTRTNGGATEFYQVRSFNADGEVTSLATTVPGQTDSQAFCYDDLGRLVWATSQTVTGGGPCGASNTAGTLTAAQYTQTYGYDNMDRLTSGPLGAYTYADGAHVHAATAIGPAGAPTWTASYDAAGNMTCRAPTSATTCVGTQTGAQLAYDAEGQLTSWQNAPSAPATTAGYLYDGAGNRVEQQVTSGGSTTSTVYVGELEEVATTGSTSTTTTYYSAGGQRVALAVNGVFSYLASDGLGSANVALDASGNAQAVTLYAPYGTVRYSSGTMPGSYGYTGQHADAATGLDYYGARYYDPAAGQFTSADTLLAGLNRYGYVGGDPANATDPSGHAETDTQEAEVGAAAPPDITIGGIPPIVLPPMDPPAWFLFMGPFSLTFLAMSLAYAAYEQAQLQLYEAQIAADTHSRSSAASQAAHGPPSPTGADLMGPVINRSTPFYVAETPPLGGAPGPSAVNGVGEQSAPAGTAGDAGMGRGGPGGAPTAGGCDDGGGDAPGGMWLYHGSPAIFDLLDVATTIATQAAASEYKMPELGPGIYFTDDSLRAAKYTANKLIGRVYRAWAPRDLLDRLPHKKISTNESEQYVVSDQADADILNRTLQSAPAYQVILN